MKYITLLVAALAAMTTAAQAQTTVTDTDGNGSYSMEELKASYADLSEETFTAIDANADGQVDAAELEAAVAAGVLPS
jgi:hypothetical protein